MIVETFFAIILSIFCYYKWAFQYWKNRNVPCTKTRIPLGSFPLRDMHMGVHIKNVYDELKSKGLKHGGGIYFLAQPRYMPIGPETIKYIVQKDFDCFTDRGFYHNKHHDPLSENLALIRGPKWHPLRTKLSHAFTPLKLKMSFDTFLQFGGEMKKAVDKHCEKQEPVNVKDISDCYTIDAVGSSAFGIECNSFKYPNGEFRQQGRRVFEKVSNFRFFKNGFAMVYPDVAKWFGIRLFEKVSAEFFLSIIKQAMMLRENNECKRKDLLQLIIDADRNFEDHGKKFTTEEITANAFAFFIGGYETSSSTITFCLYELAMKPDVQQRTREEIQRVLDEHGGEITYDAIMNNMPYFSRVYEETLRKYPAISYVTRECVKDYQVPDTETVIERGTKVVISLLGLHYDPEYFPDPNKFDPDRFSPENKQKRIPFTYMPFGEGPRNCIGLRYGLVMTRIALAIFIKNYKFTLNEKTKTPIQFDRRTFTLTPEEEIFLNVTKV